MQANRRSTTGLSVVEIDNTIKDLKKFYSVDCLEDLVLEQAEHIRKLQRLADHNQEIMSQRYYTRVRIA